MQTVKVKIMTQPKYFSGKLKIKGIDIGPEISVNSNNYSMSCLLSKDMLELAPIKLRPNMIKFCGNQMILCQFQSDKNCINGQKMTANLNSQFCIHVENDSNKGILRQILEKVYKCVYLKNQDKLKLTLHHCEDFGLSFFNVQKPKFARTQKLQKLIAGDCINEDYGIVTMDQTSRILVQSMQCQFPAVGIWVKAKTLFDVSVFFTICAFLKKKPTKQFTKLASTMNHRNYIYFVKIQENELPDLYLVSWNYKQNTSLQASEYTTIYEIATGRQTVVSLNQKNLQFTLRGEAKREQDPNNQLQFSSPKKQMTNQQLQQQLDRLHLQESPQFSSIKKQEEQSWKQTKTQLKQRVERQQQQIQTLKREVERLQKQLKKAKQSLHSPQQKPLNFFKSPSLILNSQTPAQKGKRLSSSDLELTQTKLKVFQSGSTKDKNSSEDFSNSGSQSQCKYRDINVKRNMEVVGDQEPWDMYQIIQ